MLKRADAAVFDKRQVHTLPFHFRVAYYFSRRNPGQQIVKAQRNLRVYGRAVEFSGGNIRPAYARFVLSVIYRYEIIILVRLEHFTFHDGAGRDHAYDFAFGQAFLRHRKLLAYGNFIAFFYQLCDIRIDGMKRHAAHGRPLFQAAVFSGEYEIELAARDFGILEKQFVEITQPEKQQASGILLLGFEILFHHR